MITVDRLSPEATGVWKITTQGSEHLWNMDEMTWTRIQKDGKNPMSGDGQVMYIRQVSQWPAVGSSFIVYRSRHPDGGMFWHVSSTIRSITKEEEA